MCACIGVYTRTRIICRMALWNTPFFPPEIKERNIPIVEFNPEHLKMFANREGICCLDLHSFCK